MKLFIIYVLAHIALANGVDLTSFLEYEEEIHENMTQSQFDTSLAMPTQVASPKIEEMADMDYKDVDVRPASENISELISSGKFVFNVCNFFNLYKNLILFLTLLIKCKMT